MKEIFKDVMKYESMYQVSNLGRVRSMKRKGVLNDRILKQGKDANGYFLVNLSKDGIQKSFKVHQLVAVAFLNHVPDGYKSLIVDHIDNNKLNNKLDNLQLTTARNNTSKDAIGTSIYTGVSWYKKTNKWMASISINGKVKNLGYFYSEIDAHNKYKDILESLKDFN